MTDHRHRVHDGIDSAPSDHPRLQASPAQLCRGLPIDALDRTVTCTGCSTMLEEGAHVTVYAHRSVDTTQWTVGRVYCRGCAPVDIVTPTLGTSEVLVRGRIGTLGDRHSEERLCLTAVGSVAYSPPETGCAP